MILWFCISSASFLFLFLFQFVLLILSFLLGFLLRASVSSCLFPLRPLLADFPACWFPFWLGTRATHDHKIDSFGRKQPGPVAMIYNYQVHPSIIYFQPSHVFSVHNLAAMHCRNWDLDAYTPKVVGIHGGVCQRLAVGCKIWKLS